MRWGRKGEERERGGEGKKRAGGRREKIEVPKGGRWNHASHLLGEVDADEPLPGSLGQGSNEGRLSDPGGALEEDRLAELHGTQHPDSISGSGRSAHVEPLPVCRGVVGPWAVGSRYGDVKGSDPPCSVGARLCRGTRGKRMKRRVRRGMNETTREKGNE